LAANRLGAEGIDLPGVDAGGGEFRNETVWFCFSSFEGGSGLTDSRAGDGGEQQGGAKSLHVAFDVWAEPSVPGVTPAC